MESSNLSQTLNWMSKVWRPLAVTVLAGMSLLAITLIAEGSNTKPLTPYQQQLQGEVQTVNGSPGNGRDPASQMQTSLTAAASQPAGVGLRTEKAAAGITGDHNHHVDPASVLPNPKASGKYSNGCLVGYANPGQTCVTQSAPGAKPASCTTDSTLPCVVDGLDKKKP
jgi:hypothetical protein